MWVLAHIFWKAEKNVTPFQVWGVDWQDTCIFWKRSIKLRNNWTYWDYYELAALFSHHRLLHGWLLRFKLIKFMQSKNLLLFLTKWPMSNINQKPDEWGQLVRSAQKTHQNDPTLEKNKVIKKKKKKASSVSDAWWSNVTQWQGRGLTWTWPCPRTWAAAIRSLFWLAYRRGGMVNMTINGGEGRSHNQDHTRV